MPTLADLKNELVGDPLGRGYASMSAEAAAADLNTLARSCARRTVQAQAVVECVDEAEWATITANKRDLMLSVLALAPTITLNVKIQKITLGCFPAATCPLTRAALLALANEPCSRAQELGFEHIDAAHVRAALES